MEEAYAYVDSALLAMDLLGAPVNAAALFLVSRAGDAAHPVFSALRHDIAINLLATFGLLTARIILVVDEQQRSNPLLGPYMASSLAVAFHDLAWGAVAHLRAVKILDQAKWASLDMAKVKRIFLTLVWVAFVANLFVLGLARAAVGGLTGSGHPNDWGPWHKTSMIAATNALPLAANCWTLTSYVKIARHVKQNLNGEVTAPDQEEDGGGEVDDDGESSISGPYYVWVGPVQVQEAQAYQGQLLETKRREAKAAGRALLTTLVFSLVRALPLLPALVLSHVRRDDEPLVAYIGVGVAVTRAATRNFGVAAAAVVNFETILEAVPTWLSVYSQNAKGHSNPVTIYSFTIKEAERHIAGTAHPANVTSRDGVSVTPILGILVAIGCGLALVAVAIIVVLRIRPTVYAAHHHNNNGGGATANGSVPGIGSAAAVMGMGTRKTSHGAFVGGTTHLPLATREPDMMECMEMENEKEPDLIPSNKELIEEEEAFQNYHEQRQFMGATSSATMHRRKTEDPEADRRNKIKTNFSRLSQEVTYAELTMPRNKGYAPMRARSTESPGGPGGEPGSDGGGGGGGGGRSQPAPGPPPLTHHHSISSFKIRGPAAGGLAASATANKPQPPPRYTSPPRRAASRDYGGGGGCEEPLLGEGGGSSQDHPSAQFHHPQHPQSSHHRRPQEMPLVSVSSVPCFGAVDGFSEPERGGGRGGGGSMREYRKQQSMHEGFTDQGQSAAREAAYHRQMSMQEGGRSSSPGSGVRRRSPNSRRGVPQNRRAAELMDCGNWGGSAPGGIEEEPESELEMEREEAAAAAATAAAVATPPPSSPLDIHEKRRRMMSKLRECRTQRGYQYSSNPDMLLMRANSRSPDGSVAGSVASSSGGGGGRAEPGGVSQSHQQQSQQQQQQVPGGLLDKRRVLMKALKQVQSEYINVAAIGIGDGSKDSSAAAAGESLHERRRRNQQYHVHQMQQQQYQQQQQYHLQQQQQQEQYQLQQQQQAQYQLQQQQEQELRDQEMRERRRRQFEEQRRSSLQGEKRRPPLVRWHSSATGMRAQQQQVHFDPEAIGEDEDEDDRPSTPGRRQLPRVPPAPLRQMSMVASVGAHHRQDSSAAAAGVSRGQSVLTTIHSGSIDSGDSGGGGYV